MDSAASSTTLRPKPNQDRSHYDTLKIAPDAPPELIQAAYRSLARRVHPDRNPGDAGAARQMQELNAAYAVLGDAQQRAAYDAARPCPRPPPPAGPRVRPEVERTRVHAAEAKAGIMAGMMADVRVYAARYQRRIRRLALAKLVLQVAFPIGYFGYAEHLMNNRDGRSLGCVLMFVGAPMAFGSVAALVERLYR